MAVPSTRLDADRPGATPGRWRRWPCAGCGHHARRFSVACPDCEALPWTGSASAEVPGGMGFPGRSLRPGTGIQVRGAGLFRTQHRLSTPEGFLGLLTRRLTGGADWLGLDGREWRVDRPGRFLRSWVLLDGVHPMALAEPRGTFPGVWQVWQGNGTWLLRRSGLGPCVLAAEDGPEVLRTEGGVLDPLRRIEIASPAPLALVVLAGYLACGMRQGEH